jgi:predicted DNA binding CopG/RHH family protein
VEAAYEPRQDRAKGRLTKKAAKFPTASEAEERAYWEREDSTADLDWRRAKRVRLPNLQPSTTAISLRLPVSLLEEIKIAAHKRDVPYQSLIKMWLSEKVG